MYYNVLVPGTQRCQKSATCVLSPFPAFPPCKSRLAKPAYLAKKPEISTDLSPTWSSKRKTLTLLRHFKESTLEIVSLEIVRACKQLLPHPYSVLQGSTIQITPGFLECTALSSVTSASGVRARCILPRTPLSHSKWGKVGSDLQNLFSTQRCT